MAKATYHYKDGTGKLVPVSVDASEDGTLTNAEGVEIVHGCQKADVAGDGVYVLDPEAVEQPKEKTLTRKQQEAADKAAKAAAEKAAKEAADKEAAEKEAADKAANQGSENLNLEGDPPS